MSCDLPLFGKIRGRLNASELLAAIDIGSISQFLTRSRQSVQVDFERGFGVLPAQVRAHMMDGDAYFQKQYSTGMPQLVELDVKLEDAEQIVEDLESDIKLLREHLGPVFTAHGAKPEWDL